MGNRGRDSLCYSGNLTVEEYVLKVLLLEYEQDGESWQQKFSLGVKRQIV